MLLEIQQKMNTVCAWSHDVYCKKFTECKINNVQFRHFYCCVISEVIR
jgi:hypothetical protein